MTSEPYGMFGPRGLLAKIKAEEEDDNRSDQSPRMVLENAVNESTSDGRPIGEQRKESNQKIDQCTQDVENLYLTSTPNPPITVVPLRELPPLEAAFSIEKIRNLIFSRLEHSDLLRCRLVSSSWLQMGSTNYKLLNWNKSVIRIKHYQQMKDLTTVKVNGWQRQLKDVTDFLETMSSWGHPFFYSVVLKLEIKIDQNDYLEFFGHYGFLVNSLDVTFQTIDNGEFLVYHMDSLLEFVTKLLTEQMPNLETLKVKFDMHAQFEGEIDPQLLLSIKNGLYCATKKNQNLRAIEFDKQTRYEIIEIVCSLAPKVERIQVEDRGFWEQYKHRLHLLTTLDLKPDSKYWDEVDAIAAFVNFHEHFDLKILTASFCRLRQGMTRLIKAATLLKTVFEKSCHSLEEVRLDRVCFINGTVLPRMPKVKLLSLITSFSEYDDWRWGFLPRGTSVATTFPNLHTIEFRGHGSFHSFRSLCKNEEVATVKSVITQQCNFDEDDRVFQTYFPNAVVTRC